MCAECRQHGDYCKLTRSGSPLRNRKSEVLRTLPGKLFQMIIKCNLRISIQGLDTAAAELECKNTKPGANFAKTKTNEARAWAQLCRVYGNDKPNTDYNRIKFLLALCEQYQGHSKTKRVLLKKLHRQGICLTNAPFSMAVPIMETTAKFKDELNAQMGLNRLKIRIF